MTSSLYTCNGALGRCPRLSTGSAGSLDVAKWGRRSGEAGTLPTGRTNNAQAGEAHNVFDHILKEAEAPQNSCELKRHGVKYKADGSCTGGWVAEATALVKANVSSAVHVQLTGKGARKNGQKLQLGEMQLANQFAFNFRAALRHRNGQDLCLTNFFVLAARAPKSGEELYCVRQEDVWAEEDVLHMTGLEGNSTTWCGLFSLFTENSLRSAVDAYLDKLKAIDPAQTKCAYDNSASSGNPCQKHGKDLPICEEVKYGYPDIQNKHGWCQPKCEKVDANMVPSTTESDFLFQRLGTEDSLSGRKRVVSDLRWPCKSKVKKGGEIDMYCKYDPAKPAELKVARLCTCTRAEGCGPEKAAFTSLVRTWSKEGAAYDLFREDAIKFHKKVREDRLTSNLAGMIRLKGKKGDSRKMRRQCEQDRRRRGIWGCDGVFNDNAPTGQKCSV